MEIRVLALLLGDLFVHLVEAIADHFECLILCLVLVLGVRNFGYPSASRRRKSR
jgi:hypothetical protein